MGYRFIGDALRENPLLQKCLAFSLAIVAYVEVLETQKRFVVANQLLRCATSIGANAVEAQSAESKADFIHKMKIADKEAHETYYWLTICDNAAQYPDARQLLPQLTEIITILSSIIRSSKSS